jgi:anti-sigma regulatory factor (Ser/Thr protein kinase)
VELDLQLPGGPTAPTFARSVVNGLTSQIPEDVRDDLRLLVSEVVTNSVRHAGAGPGGTIRLRVHSEARKVRLEVEDAGPGFFPSLPEPDSRRIGGWGLYLVDRIAARWGVVNNAVTRVWFEVEHPAIAA